MPWSPSSTEAFLACPMAWYLKRQGVQGRPMDTTAMDQGTEFHAAMARWWTYLNAPGFEEVGPYSENLYVDVAARFVVKQECKNLLEQGIVGVEVVLGGPPEEAARHGRYPGTCDLVTENATGLTVTDYKTKAKMDAMYADRELRETERSWQLFQYSWFVQEKFQRPVTKKRKLLVTFKPALKVWLIDYPVTQQELSKWYRGAQRIWGLMDEIESLDSYESVWQNGNSCERFGWDWRCEYHEICWSGAPIACGNDQG